MGTRCTSSRHQEWDCLKAYYVKANFTSDKWCDACHETYSETVHSYRVSKNVRNYGKGTTK